MIEDYSDEPDFWETNMKVFAILRSTVISWCAIRVANKKKMISFLDCTQCYLEKNNQLLLHDKAL